MIRHRTTPSSSRRERKRAADRQGYAILAACAVVLAAVGLSAFVLVDHVKLDTKTGCPQGHMAPVASTVVLLDETDKLSRDELAFAKSVIMNEYFWLPIGGRLTVRNIVADPDMAEDIVVCRMDDGSHELGLVRNPHKMRQDFQRIAGARLDELFTALRTAQPQKYSPILESIAAVFDKPAFGPNVRQRRLVVLSDMAQHSPLFSQYRRHAAGPRAAVAAEYHRDMHGVAIRIQYVSRPELMRIQTETHRRFWADYLRGMGGEVALGHGILLGEANDKEVWNDES